jgi:surface adhesion protein
VDVDGRTFENLQLGGARRSCHRHHRRSVAKLTATPSVTEGGEITYTITLTNKDGLPINNHGPDLHAERRQNRHHRAGQRHRGHCHRHRPGQRLRRHQRPDRQIDRYGQGADVGKFEQLTLDKTPVSTTVTDEPGTAGQRRRPGQGHHHRRPDLGRRERQTDLHRAHQPAAGPRPGRDPEQQCQVTIKAGDTSAPYEHAAQGDDVYNDAAKSAWASSRLWTSTVAPSRTCSWAVRRRSVTDTTDEVVAKLTATPSVTEGGEITYTITLTNKDGLPINNHSR